MIRHSARLFWVVLGSLALVLGAAGLVLPLLPTTPFILVAAFAFARSSPRLHSWLVQHRVFGPLIENWQRYGAISRRAKVAGLLSLMAVFGMSLLLGAPSHALVVQAIVLPVSGIFISSRPLPPSPQG
jgi:uncharacterized membrane protein YbaN (DUF454 family)